MRRVVITGIGVVSPNGLGKQAFSEAIVEGRSGVGPIESFDTAPRPFLLKCSGGQDRTSFAAALYLIHRDGWQAMPAARAQFARFPYLHFPKTHQRWLKVFVEFAREDAQGRPIRDWLQRGYDPVRLAGWLTRNPKLGPDSCAGIYPGAGK